MPRRPLPPPERGELPSIRVVDALRDYPELAPILEEVGVDPRVDGHRTLGELPEPQELLHRLSRSLAWREDWQGE